MLVELPCTLRRATGSPIAASTNDLGPSGMLITTKRPLAIDEVVMFDLALRDAGHLDGQARVVRQQGLAQYGMRFERLPEDALAVLLDFARAG